MARVQEADRRAAATADRHGAGLVAAVRALPDERRDALAAALDPFLGVRDRLAAQQTPWIAQARGQATAGQDNALRRRRAATQQALTDIQQYLPHVGAALISGLDRFDLPTALHQAKTLYEGLQAGHRLKGPLGMKSKLGKDTEEFHDAVRVDGAALDTPAGVSPGCCTASRSSAGCWTSSRAGPGRPEPWGRAEHRAGLLEDDLVALDLLADFAQRHQAVGAAVSVSPELARLDWLDPAGTDMVLRRAGRRRRGPGHRGRAARCSP